MIKFGVKVQKETYTAQIGGSKKPKKVPKKNEKGENEKKRTKFAK